MTKHRRRRHSASPAELAAGPALASDALDPAELAPAAELPPAELPSDDAPLPADAPPPPDPPLPLDALLDKAGIEAAQLLAEHFSPLGLHWAVVVTDAGGQHFSFRSATLGPNAMLGLLQRVYALAKRFYATF